MAKIHMILQGKGGVGKSFIAALLAQYKESKGKKPLCIDTDPVNATFQGFTALDVQLLNIMEEKKINSRKFDDLIEMIAATEQDIIIDNGASTFVPLSDYIISNNIPDMLSSMGHELVIHTVITGGQALKDTINGFDQLIRTFPDSCLFVVWLNPFWGPIEFEGKTFEKMKIYITNKGHVSAIIKIPDLTKETFGLDLTNLLKDRLTFKEALDNKDLTIMTRQRLKIINKQLFDQLDAAMVL
jgi:hypothetical protein